MISGHTARTLKGQPHEKVTVNILDKPIISNQKYHTSQSQYHETVPIKGQSNEMLDLYYCFINRTLLGQGINLLSILVKISSSYSNFSKSSDLLKYSDNLPGSQTPGSQ